jgi:hypothetical protein
VRFYLGTHQPHWLWRTDVPLFVSRRQLMRRASAGLKPARTSWALDSGGFTELSLHGTWTVSAEQYASEVALFDDQIGGLDFAAPQDWMCEPVMLARTGLSVREHQERTISNFLELRRLAPGLPIIPVLQGWTIEDYLTCLDLYRQAGCDLASEPRMGLGSVCRRQATAEIAHLVHTLAAVGLKLHGFGVKTRGLSRYADGLASADSMAWSYRARRSIPLPGCTTHRNCANCLIYAHHWRGHILAGLERAALQPSLWDPPAQACTANVGGGS